MRKAKVMWKDWNAGRALGLHRLQLNILRRSVAKHFNFHLLLLVND